ncbi:MAG: cysteine--tRNA ligase [Myxococcales bacterium]
MPVRVWNNLTDRKEELLPRRPGKVGIYVCGITVYDLPHLGHARMLVAFDVMVRFLRWQGLDVLYVRNWTDVDDKIIRRAIERNEEPSALSARFIEACRQDMERLNVLPGDVEPRATDHIPEMIALIESLVSKGHAYASGGDVFFAVRSFPPYGRLSRRNLDDLRSGERVESGEAKRDPLDFALWKATKPGEPGSVSWESPWGRGRPGWHIECSAMAQRYLGTTFDVHGGGRDLVFPHHENEIAQSEAASGQPLARYWLHNGFVTLDSEKMSKSLGNVRTIRDLLVHWDGEALRAFLLSTHYRHPINFTESAVADADATVDYFYETLLKAEGYLAQKKGAGAAAPLDEVRARFAAALEDDFNTAEALAILTALHGQLNARIDARGGAAEVAALADAARTLGQVMGLAFRPPAEAVRQRRTLAATRKGIDPAWVEDRIAQRIEARKARDFSRADAIRAEVLGRGVELRDGAAGTDWRVLP